MKTCAELRTSYNKEMMAERRHNRYGKFSIRYTINE